MTMKHVLTFTTLLASTMIATAGPEGRYTVSGTNLGSSGTYTGKVEVTRTGETYAVRWEVEGTTFIGSGLGAAPFKGNTIMGPADNDDYVLAVGYVTNDSPIEYGVGYYIEQADGTWEGIWTAGGADEIATEIWTPE